MLGAAGWQHLVYDKERAIFKINKDKISSYVKKTSQEKQGEKNGLVRKQVHHDSGDNSRGAGDTDINVVYDRSNKDALTISQKLQFTNSYDY